MASTTSFNWETPDDTDLVKDGAAAIRTLGNSIDTSMTDLLGGTTGQVLAKASNTNMDFTWVAQDDSNAIQNAIVDAKGDLITATAADTPARLAVGTNGQTLVADSSTATGLAWSTPSAGGGMTLISTTTLSGSSISLTSIPGTYKNLVVVVRNYKPATNGEYLIGQFNTDTGTTYRDVTASADAVGAADRANMTVSFEASNSVSNSTQNWTIYDYANATAYKQAEAISWNTNKTTTANMNFIHRNHLWYNTAAITSIQLKPSAGNFTSGTALLYGVS